MNSLWQDDKKWSDRYLLRIKKTIGEYLLVPSSFEQDTQEASDLIVLRGRDMTIACRVRRPGFLERYPDDFTIRFARDSGTKTEYQKIIEGWGDWMFYGHAKDDITNMFSRWMLIDLSHFRAHLIQNRKDIIFSDVPNGDGTHFRAFNVKSFPENPQILIAKSFI